MTKEELLMSLRELVEHDPEVGHQKADEYLIEYINDEEIRAAYCKLEKWYA